MKDKVTQESLRRTLALIFGIDISVGLGTIQLQRKANEKGKMYNRWYKAGKGTFPYWTGRRCTYL